MAQNPLLAPWTGPYGGVPPLDRLSHEHFAEALQWAIDEQRAEIEAIVGNPAPPTFANTLEALERSGRARDRVERLFTVARENVSTGEIQAIEREWQPKLSAATDAIYFNAALFARIEAIFDALDDPQLADDQRRLTRRVHERFVRRGARLSVVEKTQLSAINQELAALFAEFRQKVMADEDTWTVLERPADLAGLPVSIADAAGAAAAERGVHAPGVIVNTRSSVDPFLMFSSRRDLREQVWRRFKMRGDNNDANDTRATIARIVTLRTTRARLLGYPSHAHLQMVDTMAKEPSAAQALMRRVWPAALARVREDVADMRLIAKAEGAPDTIEPWDYLYYAEKLREAQYDLDQAALEPYFVLDRMVQSVLWSAAERFGLTFDEITGQVPVFHPDVRVWTVSDSDGGRHVGLFYLDNFARVGKKSGAWQDNYRDQQHLDASVTPLASINNNFVKGAPGEPVLISLDDVRTLYHEFGHALHALLQDIRYPGLGDASHDYVEYPSQVNENWVLTREVLDRFARHHRTGEPMPSELVKKVERARKFNQGYKTVEYLSDAMLDMELHVVPRDHVDVSAFERDELARIGMPYEVALRHRLTHFDHLFGSDSYSAGYYSYLWADVMAADTWKAFLEAGGPWDKLLARRFRAYVLAPGNASDRAEAYRSFRGADPDPRALFEARGLSEDHRDSTN